MSEYKRIICPECGNKDNRKIHEEPNKSKILYYSMQGTPVYTRNKKCGNCGHIFKKEL